MPNIALSVENLSYKYPLRSDFRLYLQELHIEEGDSFGIVGSNGSGKSTLMALLAGVLQPDTGNIISSGKVTPLLSVGSSINEYYSGYEAITTELENHLGRKPLDPEIKQCADFTELSDAVLGENLHTYSSGMKARVAFAPLVVIQPGVLIMDEMLAVGDNKFVPKAMKVIESLIDSGNALMLASHSSSLIRQHCKKAIWVVDGLIHLSGDVDDVMDEYDEWCNKQVLQYLVESNGGLNLLPGKNAIDVREVKKTSHEFELIVDLDPSAFVESLSIHSASVKITTKDFFILLEDHCTFSEQSIATFSIELTQMGTVDLMLEVLFYSDSHFHQSLIIYPRPHGIAHAGGQPLFIPNLNVIG